MRQLGAGHLPARASPKLTRLLKKAAKSAERRRNRLRHHYQWLAEHGGAGIQPAGAFFSNL